MMKKFLLSLTMVLFIFSFAKAQDLTLTWEGNPIGDTVTLWGEPTDFELVFHANLHNNSANAMNIKVARKEIYLVGNTFSQICWAGLCYSPTVDTSVNYELMMAGGTSGDEDFSGHYSPNGNIGTSIVEFIFYNIDNPSVKVSVVVKFWASPEGIAEDAMQGGRISEIYPNPATNYVNLDFNLTSAVKEAKVRIINLIGSVVKEVEIERSTNQLKLDISDLDNGVYFYSVLINGDTYKTKKLVVR
jgi:hypothetical protein